jgi:peptidoglycan/LPS O-acetylase OafA/YrhL
LLCRSSKDLADFLLPPLFLAVIVGFSLESKGLLDRLLAIPAIRWLGERSYSIYMVHALTIQLTHRLFAFAPGLPRQGIPFASFGLIQYPTWLGVGAQVFCTVLLLGLSDCTYRLIERRFMQPRPQALENRLAA